jgi:hypothetical protein
MPNDKLTKINSGLWCPDCKCDTELIDSIKIYIKKSYGMAYRCPVCYAYVGCHKNTTIALGRVAGKRLRKAKKEAHKYFDMIWKNENLTRPETYNWLSETLNINKGLCHIGMFNLRQCEDTIYFSKQLLNDLRRCDLDFGATPETEYFEL